MKSRLFSLVLLSGLVVTACETQLPITGPWQCIDGEADIVTIRHWRGDSYYVDIGEDSYNANGTRYAVAATAVYRDHPLLGQGYYDVDPMIFHLNPSTGILTCSDEPCPCERWAPAER